MLKSTIFNCIHFVAFDGRLCDTEVCLLVKVVRLPIVYDLLRHFGGDLSH